MSFLTIISVISQLMPVASALVKLVEVELPAAAGALKLSSVQTGLEAAFTKLDAIGASFGDVWPHLESLVNGMVAIYNASGLFTHAATAINTTVSAVESVGDTVAGQQTALAAQTTLGQTTVQTLTPAPTTAPVPQPSLTSSLIAGVNNLLNS